MTFHTKLCGESLEPVSMAEGVDKLVL
jgi:hypothetical protein